MTGFVPESPNFFQSPIFRIARVAKSTRSLSLDRDKGNFLVSLGHPKPVSPHNRATNGHFRSKTSLRKLCLFSKESYKNLSKLVRKGMFPTEFFGFFPQFVTHFSYQKWAWHHIFDLKKTTWLQGWEVKINNMVYENVVLKLRSWCVAMNKDFFLSFYCHGYYVVKEVINRIHEVDINKNLQWDPRKKETVVQRW